MASKMLLVCAYSNMTSVSKQIIKSVTGMTWIDKVIRPCQETRAIALARAGTRWHTLAHA